MRARGGFVSAHRWELALLGVAAVWGSTFVLVQDAVERVAPMMFLGIRFAIATVALALTGAFRGSNAREWRVGVILGLALFAGYAFQTVGLQYTTASNAGFLTGMFVVFTPVIGALVFRRLPSRAATMGVALATAGMVLLTMPSGLTIGKGDTLEILTAISFAAHIVLIAILARGLSALRLTAIQLATVTLIASAWTAVADRVAAPTDASVWIAAGFTAVVATALAFFVQTRAQQVLPPVRTAVLLAAEPAFAGIAGYVLAGDRFGVKGALGALLIFGGIVVASLRAPATETL